MDEMKGPGKPLLRCISNLTMFELIMFGDESLAICRAGHTHSVWEPAERADCLNAFFGLAGLDKEPDLIVLMGRSAPTPMIHDLMAN